MSIEQVRSAVSGLPRSSGGRIQEVPASLRAEILSLAKASGEPRYRFAKSIGLSGSVLSCWGKGKRHGQVRKFKPMRVVSAAMPVGGGWTVEGPLGLRVSGMTVEELSLLFRKLEGR